MSHSLKERNKEKQVQFFFFPVASLYISKTEHCMTRQKDAEGGGVKGGGPKQKNWT